MPLRQVLLIIQQPISILVYKQIWQENSLSHTIKITQHQKAGPAA